LPSGKVLHTLAGHTGGVNGVAFSPDGEWLATASEDLTVMVWDTGTGQGVRKLTGHTAENKGKTNRPTGVVAVTFSPQCAPARCPLAAVGMDGQLIVWDATSGQTLFTYQDKVGGLKSLAYSPDGKLLAVGNTGDPTQSIGAATILDATTGQVVRVLPGEMGWVFGLAFSPDGKRLATTYFYGLTKVWDVATGQALLSMQGPPNYAVAVSPEGTRLATNGNEARLWDAQSGQSLLSLNALTGYAVTFSPDGKYVATAHFDGSVRLYVVRPEDLLALARSRVTRSLTPEECQKYLHVETCPATP
jgi:WD40 repeat protein